MIKEFQGENRLLSNFWIARQTDGFDNPGNPYTIYPQVQKGVTFTYPSNEHYFAANKADNLIQHLAILNAPSPAIAKKMGGKKGYVMPDGTLFKVKLRPNWNIIRVPLMARGISLKFGQNIGLAGVLVLTWPKILQEGNRWHDTFWGVDLDTGIGENMLGKILMDQRDDYIARIIQIYIK